MDEAEAMVGMSDDENSSGKGEHTGDSASLITDNNEAGEGTMNGTGTGNDLINVALEDDVGDEDDEEDDDDDDETMNPVSAASALSDLVGSVGSVVTGLPSLNTNQNHHQSEDTTGQSAPTRYLQVEGYDGRKNDVVYCKPLRCSVKHAENSLEHTNNDQSSSATGSASEADAQTKSQKGESEEKPKLMLFFGGDIQDFPEMMEQHRDHRNYVQFNLEATALQLQKQYPDHHIAVIRPSRIQMLTFSCYDNFVHCNHTGAPEHVITHHSLHHLELLLQNLSKRIAASSKENSTVSEEMNTGESGSVAKNQQSSSKESGSPVGKSNCNNGEDSTVSSTTVDDSSSKSPSKMGNATSTPTDAGQIQCNNSASTNGSTSKLNSKNKANTKDIRLDRSRISIVGFSKGCVVLNQLLYEFHYLKTLTPDDLSMDSFLQCIKDMYWLDGGHNGGKNTWITSRSLLETLTRLGVCIHVHLTPYQLLDDRRPWIRKEERMFSELLKKFNAPIVRQIHFENEPASLQQHLRIIGDFSYSRPSQQQSLLHRGSDGIDGGGMHLDNEESHKPVVNVVDADPDDSHPYNAMD